MDTMSQLAGDGRVTSNQASIPSNIRDALDIEDGDVIRWEIEDGDLTVTIVRKRTGVFDDFEPGQGDEPVDMVDEHDGFGLES